MKRIVNQLTNLELAGLTVAMFIVMFIIFGLLGLSV